MTKATATLAVHHRTLFELLAPLRAEARQDERLLAMLDAAMAQLALETAALRVLREHGDVDADEHHAAHGRARVALFRMATSPSDSAIFGSALDELRDVFGERPRRLIARLGERLDAPAMMRLDQAIEATLGSRCPAATTTASSPPRPKTFSEDA
jgi:hypothetical protein